MENVEWLIKHEREGSKLDFKREPYHKEKYSDLIKDIISMANTPISGKRYIIFGVKDKPDGTKEFYSIPKESIVDQATYQQLLRENVEPSINFNYYIIEVDENYFGVIEIDECNDPPYMMKKDYKGLKKGDCFVRKGTQQERMTRRDLEEMLNFKSKYQFNGKIKVGFSKQLERCFEWKAVENIQLPSAEAKEEIISILDARSRGLQEAPLFELNTSIFGTRYEQRTTETLKKNLENVTETYCEDDWYHICEEKASKINILVNNEGEQYLEDVLFSLKIPNDNSLLVVEERVSKPVSNPLININQFTETSNYPDVTKQDGFWIVENEIGDLRHNQLEEAFHEDLRVYFGSKSKNKTYTWEYTIHARNLPKPISGELNVKIT